MGAAERARSRTEAGITAVWAGAHQCGGRLIAGNGGKPVVEYFETLGEHCEPVGQPLALGLQRRSLADRFTETWTRTPAPGQVCQMPVKFVQPRCEAPEQVSQLLSVGFQKLERARGAGMQLPGGLRHGRRTGHSDSLRPVGLSTPGR